MANLMQAPQLISAQNRGGNYSTNFAAALANSQRPTNNEGLALLGAESIRGRAARDTAWIGALAEGQRAALAGGAALQAAGLTGAAQHGRLMEEIRADERMAEFEASETGGNPGMALAMKGVAGLANTFFNKPKPLVAPPVVKPDLQPIGGTRTTAGGEAPREAAPSPGAAAPPSVSVEVPFTTPNVTEEDKKNFWQWQSPSPDSFKNMPWKGMFEMGSYPGVFGGQG